MALGPTSVRPTASLGELAEAGLRRQLANLLAHEPGTRLGQDPEELHDMRVATRRLRAGLDLFAEVLPARAGTLGQELAWLAGALGEVRDLDVQLERLEEMERRDGVRLGQSADPLPLDELRTLLYAERERARRDLLGALDSSRWVRLTEGLTALASQGPDGRRAAARLEARSVVPGLIESGHRSLLKAARRAERRGDPTALHRLRIRAKRFRYTLEFTADLYGEPALHLVRQLAKLQDSLGRIQDAEVARRRLRELAGGTVPPLSPGTVFAMGSLAEWYRGDAERARAQLPGRLRAVSGDAWEALADRLERS